MKRLELGITNRQCLKLAVIAVLTLLIVTRYLHLSADFPIGLASSGAAYTDEGWWSRNAVAILREGHWYIDDGYNTILNLPTVPLMQTIWFKVFGISQVSARSLTVTCSVIVCALVYAIARRELPPSLAWIAPFIFLSNYPTFAFSRIALLEMPMLMLIMLSLWLVTLPLFYSKDLNQTEAAQTQVEAAQTNENNLSSLKAFTLIISALISVLAVLAKITALFAIPMILAMIAIRPTAWQNKTWQIILWLLTFIIAYSLYHTLITQEAVPTNITDTYNYFARYNVTRKLHDSLFSIVKGPLRVIKYCLEVFPLLFPALIISVTTLIRAKSYRESHTFQIVVLWSALFLSGLSASNYAAPRYFIVLIVPISLSVPLTLSHFCQHNSRQAKVSSHKKISRRIKTKTVFLMCVYLSITLSFLRISHYLTTARYTFEQMAQQVTDKIDRSPNHPSVLMGHFADSIVLTTSDSATTKIKAVNDKLGHQSLPYRIETFNPGYYISIGEVKPSIAEALTSHYDMNLVQQFNVYQNHDFGEPIFFYRLTLLRSEKRIGVATQQ